MVQEHHKCNGKEYTLFQELNPGSEFCCHPVLLVRAEETDPDIPYTIHPKKFRKWMFCPVRGIQWKLDAVSSLKFISTMYDGKKESYKALELPDVTNLITL